MFSTGGCAYKYRCRCAYNCYELNIRVFLMRLIDDCEYLAREGGELGRQPNWGAGGVGTKFCSASAVHNSHVEGGDEVAGLFFEALLRDKGRIYLSEIKVASQDLEHIRRFLSAE